MISIVNSRRRKAIWKIWEDRLVCSDWGGLEDPVRSRKGQGSREKLGSEGLAGGRSTFFFTEDHGEKEANGSGRVGGESTQSAIWEGGQTSETEGNGTKKVKEKGRLESGDSALPCHRTWPMDLARSSRKGLNERSK